MRVGRFRGCVYEYQHTRYDTAVVSFPKPLDMTVYVHHRWIDVRTVEAWLCNEHICETI